MFISTIYLLHLSLTFVTSFACVQRVFYFPLEPKLKALLSTPAYRSMCQHEFFRPKPHNTNLMYDVYDSEAWKKLMGPCVFPNNRIGKSISSKLSQILLSSIC